MYTRTPLECTDASVAWQCEVRRTVHPWRGREACVLYHVHGYVREGARWITASLVANIALLLESVDNNVGLQTTPVEREKENRTLPPT